MEKVVVKKVTYKNEMQRNAFFISEDGRTFKGYFPIIEDGFVFELEYVTEFNHSFNKEECIVTKCKFPILDSSKNLLSFLSAEYLYKTYRNKTAIDYGTLISIDSKIGLDYLKIFKDNKEVLNRLGGKELSDNFRKQINALSENILNTKKSYTTYNLLLEYGFDSSFSSKVAFSEYRFFKPSFEKNPYELLRHFEYNWNDYDRVVLGNGISPNSEIREEAALLYIIDENTRMNSDICINKKEALKKIPSFLKKTYSNESFSQLVSSMFKKELIFEDLDDNIYTRVNYLAEDNLAFNLLRLNKDKTSKIQLKVDEALDEEFLSDGDITLADSQKNAVQGYLKHNLSILLGPAGSGKTTTLKKMIAAAREYESKKTGLKSKELDEFMESNLLLIAPTGMAKERMRVSTGQESYTIHSVLGLSPIYMDATYNSANKLSQKYIFIDEMSMVDTVLANKILESVDEKSTVVFIGDTNQLPSIGPGRVLYEMVHSGIIKVFELDCIFRQGEDSHVLELSQNVSKSDRDKVLQSLQVVGNELLVLHDKQAYNIQNKLTELVRGLIRHSNLDFYRDIQILSPMNVSELGTRKLNLLIQEIFMKENGYSFNKKNKFNLHDKVMQLLNDADKGVFNGQIGKVIFQEGNLIKVQFNNDKIVEYTKQDASIHLEISYVTTIHKMQGSESNVIIMLCHFSFKRMLDKTLLYTGVTRAKQRLVLIGDMDAFIFGAMTDKTNERKSYIRTRIQDNELKVLVSSK